MTAFAPASTAENIDDAASVITVVSIPAGHPYVTRVTAAPGVDVLPNPAVPGAAPDVWWPPVALDPAWIDANRDAADLLHIHFGTESFTPDHLRACIDAAHRAGWPVVFTAHDLDHPQLVDQGPYAAQLDVLIPGADAVITLTETAADVIRERWGRDSLVIPHPSMTGSDDRVPHVRASDDIRVGVHFKDLRSNVDGAATAQTLGEAVALLRADGVPAVAELRLHHRVRDQSVRDQIRAQCGADDFCGLIEHERLSDAELSVALSRLDVCVLPYRHGTHSGWLELCWDLGVPVAVPAVGHYAAQHDDGSTASFELDDPASLAGAVSRLLRSDASTRAGSSEREQLIAQRRRMRQVSDRESSAAHAELYRRLVAEHRT